MRVLAGFLGGVATAVLALYGAMRWEQWYYGPGSKMRVTERHWS